MKGLYVKHGLVIRDLGYYTDEGFYVTCDSVNKL